MNLWTFIADFSGGTYIVQCSANTLRDALRWYAVNQPHQDFFQLEGIADDVDFLDAVPITGTESVWCTSALDTKTENLVSLNIILTRTQANLERQV